MSLPAPPEVAAQPVGFAAVSRFGVPGLSPDRRPQKPDGRPTSKGPPAGTSRRRSQDSGIEIHGWATVGGNWSTARNSNLPTAYWIVPNSIQLDQLSSRSSARSTGSRKTTSTGASSPPALFGIDYRYTTAGGVFSQQLLYHNNLYGFDPVEFYGELYVPESFEGMVIRLGRWIACPDIEAQYAPDNYLASHSLLFTYDTYTQTGAMFSFQLNQRNMVQGAIQSGTDMAPWYAGALPTGFFGWRWVSASNNDAFYTCLNNINDGKFRYFMADGHKAGHDNFNYIVTTWEHRFSKKVHTKTEAYFMWQFDAVVGGTPSLGPPMSFGGGGGLGKFIPGARSPTACSTTRCTSSRTGTTSPSATSGGPTRKASGPASQPTTPATRSVSATSSMIC